MFLNQYSILIEEEKLLIEKFSKLYSKSNIFHIIDIIENNINKIDLKFEKSSNEHLDNLNIIREKIGIIDKAQENISGLSENVLNLKNILSNTSKRGRFGEILLENLIKDHDF